MGDMNFPDIDWLDDPPSARTEGSKAFVGTYVAWNLSQILQGPTKGLSWLGLILATDTSVHK